MLHDQSVNELRPPGPDPDDIVNYILETYPETDMVAIEGAWFFSLDPERHFPNYATIVTADDPYDSASDLARPGIFRLNLGLDRATFTRLVGNQANPDYTVIDQFFPHPVYARQLYVSILNPSPTTFEVEVKPLIALAHDRLAAQRARHRRGHAGGS